MSLERLQMFLRKRKVRAGASRSRITGETQRLFTVHPEILKCRFSASDSAVLGQCVTQRDSTGLECVRFNSCHCRALEHWRCPSTQPARAVVGVASPKLSAESVPLTNLCLAHGQPRTAHQAAVRTWGLFLPPFPLPPPSLII